MRLRLAIPCRREQLAPLLGAIDDALLEQAVAAELRSDLRLIAEEVACNAIDHGHCDGEAAPRELVVSLAREGDHLHIEFRDDGQPFDPLSHPLPDLDAHILDRPIGGLGVHLVRELAHSVHYAREEPYNVLHVVLLAR